MKPSVGFTTIALLAAGCAARGPSPLLVAEVGKADAVMLEGCYRCLEEALETFERVASDPRAPARATQGAFQTALLLAVRSKELGLPFESFLNRARTLAAALPVTPGAVPPSAYLGAVEYFDGEVSGLDPEIRQQLARQRRTSGSPSTVRTPPLERDSTSTRSVLDMVRAR